MNIDFANSEGAKRLRHVLSNLGASSILPKVRRHRRHISIRHSLAVGGCAILALCAAPAKPATALEGERRTLAAVVNSEDQALGAYAVSFFNLANLITQFSSNDHSASEARFPDIVYFAAEGIISGGRVDSNRLKQLGPEVVAGFESKRDYKNCAIQQVRHPSVTTTYIVESTSSGDADLFCFHLGVATHLGLDAASILKLEPNLAALELLDELVNADEDR